VAVTEELKLRTCQSNHDRSKVVIEAEAPKSKTRRTTFGGTNYRVAWQPCKIGLVRGAGSKGSPGGDFEVSVVLNGRKREKQMLWRGEG
jgi:hypothetical protein